MRGEQCCYGVDCHGNGFNGSLISSGTRQSGHIFVVQGSRGTDPPTHPVSEQAKLTNAVRREQVTYSVEWLTGLAWCTLACVAKIVRCAVHLRPGGTAACLTLQPV